MDGYFQSTLAANAISQSINNSRPGINQITRVIQPYPSTNREFRCDEFHTPEGAYHLIQEIFLQNIPPQFSVGTHLSIVTVKSVYPQHLSIPSTKSSSLFSSVSENTTTPLSSTEKFDYTIIESSEDEGQGLATIESVPSISGTQGKVSALPIPNAQRRVSSRSIAASSSSSSIEHVRHVSGSSLRNCTNGNGTTSQYPNSPLMPNVWLNAPSAAQPIPSNGSYTNVNDISGSATLSSTVETFNDEMASSLMASSSVGSLSSLFNRNGQRHPRKPKNNLAKTKSSFVAQIIMHEQLSKKLQARSANDPFLFYNVGMSFVWMDGYQRSKEPLSRIVFTKGCPTCHDVNMLTRCNDHLDVIIGFSSGDCVWYDPLSGRYIRLNKGGVLNSSSVTNVKWIPGSEDLFMASFSDGTIMILDKEKEDQTFSVPSVSSWTSDQFQASKPHRNTKYNPVSHWRVNTKGVSAFEFSPNGEHVAVVGMDGQLRIINYQKERLEDVFGSYYGQLLCVAWSPDGRYLLTGGQDDLVTIWAFPEQRIVARCQGHKSWVTGVAFDPWRCDDRVYRFCSVGDDCKLIFWDFSFNALHRPKQRGRGISDPILHPPKSPKNKSFTALPSPPTDMKKSRQLSIRKFGSTDTTTPSSSANPNYGFPSSFNRFRKRPSRSSGGVFGSLTMSDMAESIDEACQVPLPTLHLPPPKSQVSILQPTATQMIHADPCVDILFREDAVITTDRRGRIRIWGRPSIG